MSIESEPGFEQAVRQLESIVQSLEAGEPELAKAVAKYESGVRLLARCYALLEGAERSVALLTGVDDEGRPITAPFAAKPTAEAEPSDAAERGPAPRKPPRSKRPRPATTASEPDDDLDLPF